MLDLPLVSIYSWDPLPPTPCVRVHWRDEHPLIHTSLSPQSIGQNICIVTVLDARTIDLSRSNIKEEEFIFVHRSRGLHSTMVGKHGREIKGLQITMYLQ